MKREANNEVSKEHLKKMEMNKFVRVPQTIYMNASYKLYLNKSLFGKKSQSDVNSSIPP